MGVMTEVEVEQGAPAPDEPEAPPSPSARTDWVTLALDIAVWLWPLAVAAYLYNWVGHLGYNPTDDGFVLAGAQRLLHFQVPLLVARLLVGVIHGGEVGELEKGVGRGDRVHRASAGESGEQGPNWRCRP